MPLDKSNLSVLPPRAVAAMFGVSVDAVRMWAEAGKLRGFRTPGGQWRFRREDVEAFLPEDGDAEAAS